MQGTMISLFETDVIGLMSAATVLASCMRGSGSVLVQSHGIRHGGRWPRIKQDTDPRAIVLVTHKSMPTFRGPGRLDFQTIERSSIGSFGHTVDFSIVTFLLSSSDRAWDVEMSIS